jgi:hypothetical protein
MGRDFLKTKIEMETIVKQIPDAAAELVGLAKYGMSKLPGTKQATQPGIGPDGRWITGIDENALSVAKIENAEERKKIQIEKKTLREKLEKALGQNLDAGPNNPFWDDYLVDLTSMKIIDMDNPKHRLELEVALANGDIAPSLESTSTPEYRNAKFYLYIEEDEARATVSLVRLKDEAKSKLVEIAKNKKKLDLVGRYVLPKKIRADLSEDTKYQLLSMWIDENVKDQKVSNAERFLKVVEMKNEELYVKLIMDDAIAKKVIRFRENRYQRGNITYGRTPGEVLEFLSNDENQLELASIKSELEQEHLFKL